MSFRFKIDRSKLSFGIKTVLWVLIFLPFLINASYARSKFSNRLYCLVQGNSARVYLMQEPATYKCSDYLSTFNFEFRKRFLDLQQIDKNLKRGDDIEYRTNLYEAKRASILSLYEQIQTLTKTMEEFESSFLMRAQDYVAVRILILRDNLTHQQLRLQEELLAQYSPQKQKRLLLIESILDHLRIVQNTKDIDEFYNSLQQYLSLFNTLNLWK